ncbi:hypothetical protein SPD89_11465, partial [Pseudogracilibacillus sp. SO30301A]
KNNDFIWHFIKSLVEGYERGNHRPLCSIHMKEKKDKVFKWLTSKLLAEAMKVVVLHYGSYMKSLSTHSSVLNKELRIRDG